MWVLVAYVMEVTVGAFYFSVLWTDNLSEHLSS